MGELLSRSVTHLLANIKIAKQAPIFFGATVIVVAITAISGTALYFNLAKNPIIEQQKAVINFQDEQLSAFRQVQPNSVNSEDRHLSKDERKKLLDVFGSYDSKLPVIFITAFPDQESKKYANEFLEIFNRSAIPTDLLSGSITEPGQTGMMVGLVDREHPSEEARKFIKLLSVCGFEVKIVKWSGRDRPGLIWPPNVPTADYDLFIGPK